MGTKQIKLYVDRIEENKIIAFDDDRKEHILQEHVSGICESDILEVQIDENNNVCVIKVLKEETKRKKQNLLSRLKRLFKNEV